MTDESPDLLLRNLARLSAYEPDAGRSRRVRARCHAAIARRRRSAERSARYANVIAGRLEPALVGGLCVAYLMAVARTLLRLHNVQ